MYPLFYKHVARELVPKLAVIFRHSVRGGRFPGYWRLADVVPVPKESTSLGCLRLQVSIMHVLSKVFEEIVAGKLSNFLESNNMLSLSQSSYRRGLGNLMLFLHCFTAYRLLWIVV